MVSAPSPADTLFGHMRIGLGCMGLSGLFGHVERSAAIKTIHKAIDCGIRHFDTAELYGPFIGENILAEALSQSSAVVSVATKVGYKFSGNKMAGLDGSSKSIRLAVEGSLRRLNVECVDLVYLHRVDPNVPLEESLQALADCKREGKIGSIGLSKVTEETVLSADKIATVSAVQNEYSVLKKPNKLGLVSSVKKGDKVLIAYSPLARGLLTDNARKKEHLNKNDFRRTDPRFEDAQLKSIKKATAILRDVAKSHHVCPEAIALSWVLGLSDNLAVIPGCRSEKQVLSAISASTVKLSQAEMDEISLIDCK